MVPAGYAQAETGASQNDEEASETSSSLPLMGSATLSESWLRTFRERVSSYGMQVALERFTALQAGLGWLSDDDTRREVRFVPPGEVTRSHLSTIRETDDRRRHLALGAATGLLLGSALAVAAESAAGQVSELKLTTSLFANGVVLGALGRF